MIEGKENDMTNNNIEVDNGVKSLAKKTAYHSSNNLPSIATESNKSGNYGNSYYYSENSEDLVEEGSYGPYGGLERKILPDFDRSSESNDSTEEEVELAITIRCYPYMTVQLDDKPLGGGAYGSVSRRLAILSEKDCEIVACKEVSGKRIKKYPRLEAISKSALTQEIKIYTSISHENIITFLGADNPYAPTKFFMEYAPEGTLEKIILDETIELPFETVVNYALQIARALEHLDSIDIVHGDLHTGNVLKTKNNTLKISDFGCASSKQLPQVAEGNPLIFSPERFKDSKLEPRKPDDIWAFAHILRELATREKAYPGLKSHEYKKIKKIVVNPQIKLKLPTSVPSRYRFIANLCRMQNPKHRPVAATVVDQLGRVEKWYARSK